MSPDGCWSSNEPVVKEPIAGRIIETPENLELTELRDDTSGFIAYVPPGSLKRGKFLVDKGGDGTTMPCCPVPRRRFSRKRQRPVDRGPLAQLHCSTTLRHADRLAGGQCTQLMQIPVLKLTTDDMVVAYLRWPYLASLRPWVSSAPRARGHLPDAGR